MKQPDVSRHAPYSGCGIDLAGAEQVESLVSEISNNSFAIAHLGVAYDDPTRPVARVSDLLDLGEPQVPALYRLQGAENYSSPYQELQSSTDDEHPGFSTTAGQAWHVDGTLDDIGTLKTTILYCVRSAYLGGDTQIFHAVSAFEELRRFDAQAAEALMSPTVLERWSTIPGIDAKAIGPAFTLAPNGEVFTRFTDNDSCSWNYMAGTAAGSLERALKFLREAVKDPRYRTSVRLEAGEALIFRNDRVSHGRTSYKDDPKARRLLVRSVYNRAPRIPS